ncbi:hypothetical protein [Nostoc sp. MS1]|uniref:hypothetical protein n=1 Tax=Nostoc sp. MS1 TaxID=2764711 RepID=UPI001CC79ACB|nr:hypothetical protein [Nostoc sp. MS1]BCL40014.1 hypothetical protein NSMS1_64610 [Nostoc sp. MS1]
MQTTLTNAEAQKLFIAHNRIHNILMGYKTTLRLVLNSTEVQTLQESNVLKTENLLLIEDAIVATEEMLTVLSDACEKIMSGIKADIDSECQTDLIAKNINADEVSDLNFSKIKVASSTAQVQNEKLE